MFDFSCVIYNQHDIILNAVLNKDLSIYLNGRREIVSELILWVPQLNNIRALVNIQILPCLGHYQGDWAKENVWVE